MSPPEKTTQRDQAAVHCGRTGTSPQEVSSVLGDVSRIYCSGREVLAVRLAKPGGEGLQVQKIGPRSMDALASYLQVLPIFTVFVKAFKQMIHTPRSTPLFRQVNSMPQFDFSRPENYLHSFSGDTVLFAPGSTQRILPHKRKTVQIMDIISGRYLLSIASHRNRAPQAKQRSIPRPSPIYDHTPRFRHASCFVLMQVMRSQYSRYMLY